MKKKEAGKWNHELNYYENYELVILSNGFQTVVYKDGKRLDGLTSVIFEQLSIDELAVLKTEQFILKPRKGES